MREVHYATLSGSKIGKDVRKRQFLKTAGHTNPGPGSYKGASFVDKTTAPKFGFGSSQREKNYIGLSKKMNNITGPGPSSYKVPVHIGKTAQFAIPNKNQKYVYV